MRAPIPMTGSQAPLFQAKAVINGRIRELSLEQYRTAGEWVILMFIPMAWSSVCPTEILGFNKRDQEFQARECSAVFVSTDSEYALRAWNAHSADEGGLDHVHVPLVSDKNLQISSDYGVLLEDQGIALRAAFIIDPKGIIRYVGINDAKIGRSVDEIRRMLDALKFADEFGEGCPLDWKKGDRGIDMDAGHHKPSAAASNVATNVSMPQRPGAVRQNTWSGWFGKGAPGAAKSPTSSSSPAVERCEFIQNGDISGGMMSPTSNNVASRFNARALSNNDSPSDQFEGPRHSDVSFLSPSLLSLVHSVEIDDPMDVKNRAIWNSVS